jgi:hypothetical protein
LKLLVSSQPWQLKYRQALSQNFATASLTSKSSSSQAKVIGLKKSATGYSVRDADNAGAETFIPVIGVGIVGVSVISVPLLTATQPLNGRGYFLPQSHRLLLFIIRRHSSRVQSKMSAKIPRLTATAGRIYFGSSVNTLPSMSPLSVI